MGYNVIEDPSPLGVSRCVDKRAKNPSDSLIGNSCTAFSSCGHSTNYGLSDRKVNARTKRSPARFFVRAFSFLLFRENTLLIGVEMLERNTRAAHHTVIRIVCELSDDARTAIHELWHLAKLR